MEKGKSNKNQKNNTTVIIICLAVLLAVAAFFSRGLILESNIETELIEVPRVKVSLSSSKDGEEHDLSADFFVDADVELSATEVEEVIISVVKDIDYNLLTQKDSLKEVNNLIKDKLIQKYPDANVKNVYAKNFLTDYPLTESTNSKSIDNRLKDFQIE